MDYRLAASGTRTFESEPLGCGCALGISAIFVPMWAIPVGIVSEWAERGFSPIFVVLALVDVLLWIGLVFFATSGERLILDGEGVRWETFRKFGPVTTPARVRRSAPWPLVSATLIRELRTSKNGKPFEQTKLQLTMPDGTHDVLADAFKPWPELLRELEARLGDRWKARDDHGALGAAVQRMVDQRLGEGGNGERPPNDVRVE